MAFLPALGIAAGKAVAGAAAKGGAALAGKAATGATATKAAGAAGSAAAGSGAGAIATGGAGAITPMAAKSGMGANLLAGLKETGLRQIGMGGGENAAGKGFADALSKTGARSQEANKPVTMSGRLAPRLQTPNYAQMLEQFQRRG